MTRTKNGGMTGLWEAPTKDGVGSSSLRGNVSATSLESDACVASARSASGVALNVLVAIVMMALVALVSGCLFAGSAFAADEVYSEGTLQYTIDDGSITITNDFGNDAEVTVPNMIGGLPVNAIASGAFANNTHVTKINLPDCVMDISATAFATGQTVVFNANTSKSTTVTVVADSSTSSASSGDTASLFNIPTIDGGQLAYQNGQLVLQKDSTSSSNGASGAQSNAAAGSLSNESVSFEESDEANGQSSAVANGNANGSASGSNGSAASAASGNGASGSSSTAGSGENSSFPVVPVVVIVVIVVAGAVAIVALRRKKAE